MHRTWRAFVLTAVSAAVGHVLLPPAPRGTAYMVVGVVALAAAIVGIRARRGARPAWALLATGTACMVAGDALWWWYGLHGVDPLPSLADVFYLAGYPFHATGLLTLLRRRTPGGDRAGLDATIIATGTGVLAWVFVMEPYVADTTLTAVEQAVSLAYPFADVLLVGVAARLVFARTGRAAADRLLGLGLLAVLAADIAFALQELGGGYIEGGATDVTWLCGYVLFGAAALRPSGPHVPAAGTADMTMSRTRMVGLACASLVAPAVLAAEAVQGSMPSLLVIAGGSAALFLLVLLRMEGLVRQVQRQAAELADLAATDALTGLANRRTWNLELLRTLEIARRDGAPLCMALIDLDRFKRYNDEHGHLAGDELLQRAAQQWRPHLRAGDLLARYGGEEFALLLPATSARRAVQVIERLREAMPQGQNFSAGLAVWDRDEGALMLTERADQALYQAKAAGRGRTITAAPQVSGSAPFAIR